MSGRKNTTPSPFRKKESTKVIASSLTSLLNKLLGVLIMAFMTPFLFHSLGERVYGIYVFTQKLSLFGGVSNFGATSYLKIRLCGLPQDGADAECRRAIGECIAQWCFLLPLLIAFVVVVMQLISGENQLDTMQYLAVFTLIILTPVGQILSIPQVALFSRGLAYKGTVVSVLCTALGALLTVLLIWKGFGLSAIAISMASTMLISFFAMARLASRELQWFGVARPDIGAVLKSMKSSVGASLASLSYLALQQYESLIFGFAMGAAIVGKIVLTGFVVHLLELFVRVFIQSSLPSLGQLIARGEEQELARIRSKTQMTINLVFSVFLLPFALVTEPIISIWVSSDAYISFELVCIVVVLSQIKLIIQFDAQLLDQFNSFYRKASVFVIGMCAVLVGADILKREGLSVEMVAASCTLLLFFYAAYVSWLLVKIKGGNLQHKTVVLPTVIGLVAVVLCYACAGHGAAMLFSVMFVFQLVILAAIYWLFGGGAILKEVCLLVRDSVHDIRNR